LVVVGCNNSSVIEGWLGVKPHGINESPGYLVFPGFSVSPLVVLDDKRCELEVAGQPLVNGKNIVSRGLAVFWVKVDLSVAGQLNVHVVEAFPPAVNNLKIDGPFVRTVVILTAEIQLKIKVLVHGESSPLVG